MRRLACKLQKSFVTRAGGGQMWKAIRDAIKSDECTVRFLTIVAGLTVAAVILALLTAVIFAGSGPSAAGSLVTAFRAIIGQLGGGQVLSGLRGGAETGHMRRAGRGLYR